MIPFLADEDFNNRIVRGIRRMSPAVDIVRVHEAGLLGFHDRDVLARAAAAERVLLTHDAATMINFAYERIDSGKQMPGLIVVSQFAPIGKVIDDLVLIASAGERGDFDKTVTYIPLR